MESDTQTRSRRFDRTAGRRRHPADTTYKETQYLEWLSQNRVPIVVKLVDGEQAHGWIEYFDRDVIRLTCSAAPNLFIFKSRIKYLYEDWNDFARRQKRLSRS